MGISLNLFNFKLLFCMYRIKISCRNFGVSKFRLWIVTGPKTGIDQFVFIFIIKSPPLAFHVSIISVILSQIIHRRYTDSPIQIRCWYDANPYQVTNPSTKIASVVHCKTSKDNNLHSLPMTVFVKDWNYDTCKLSSFANHHIKIDVFYLSFTHCGH